MRRREQRLRRLDLYVEIGAEHGLRVGEGLHHVDDDQRRPLAEADLQAEAALFEKLFVAVRLLVGHCFAPRLNLIKLPRDGLRLKLQTHAGHRAAIGRQPRYRLVEFRRKVAGVGLVFLRRFGRRLFDLPALFLGQSHAPGPA